jgi:predicted  nucleic acid-binding Zn-ribbon protein
MTKSAKPKTIKDWQKVCNNLNAALKSAMEHEDELNDDIDHHLSEILKLEEQLTMSVGVIKYLETKIVRPDPV